MEKKSFQPNPNDHFDTEMRLKAIEGGVASHQAKIKDENRLAVPSRDESDVQDWIRNRVEVPEDMVSNRDVFKVEKAKQPEGDYEEDLKKLKYLTRDQLKKLLDETEEKSKEGVGLFSKGSLLNGFAIDPETLNSIQTTTHGGIKENLAIEILNKMDSENIDENTESQLKKRIINGFIYLEVPGFKTPIVRLWLRGIWTPEKYIEKIVNHIKRERKLLPISFDFEAL
jgi:hypothetical protein